MKRELIKCWEKDKNLENVVYLMRDSFGSRRMEMKGYVGCPMFKLCENFPMLKDEKYVSPWYSWFIILLVDIKKIMGGIQENDN